MRLEEITIEPVTGLDPALHQSLLKLHKHAVGGFTAKTAQRVLALFPGWTMDAAVFIKPSDQTREFSALTVVTFDDPSYPEAHRRRTTSISQHASGQVVDGRRTTRLEISSFTHAEAVALHAKVGEFLVSALPAPKQAKAGDFFVMNLTEPVAEPRVTSDITTHIYWVWSFDLYRKCRGWRITAPDGQHFEVCGPDTVLGTGTRDFAAFFTWALAHTGLEAAINAGLGLAKHVKVADRPRLPVGGQIIGTCAICHNEQVVQSRPMTIRAPGNERMVNHGYQRPGHGYLVGACFGVGYPPYETSADACHAYIPHLESIRDQYRRRLAALQDGKIVQFTQRGWRRGRAETTVVKHGEPGFAAALQAAIRDAEQQITYITADIATMQARIRDWHPGTLRRNGMPPTSLDTRSDAAIRG